jgi:hypothetical protein
MDGRHGSAERSGPTVVALEIRFAALPSMRAVYVAALG